MAKKRQTFWLEPDTIDHLNDQVFTYCLTNKIRAYGVTSALVNDAITSYSWSSDSWSTDKPKESEPIPIHSNHQYWPHSTQGEAPFCRGCPYKKAHDHE